MGEGETGCDRKRRVGCEREGMVPRAANEHAARHGCDWASCRQRRPGLQTWPSFFSIGVMAFFHVFRETDTQ